jgi:16S rRNA processing protein RimM
MSARPRDEGADDAGWVRVGVVARPHGVKGGLKLHLDNPDGALLRNGLVLRVGDDEHVVTRVYGPSLVELESVSGRDAAEALRSKEVQARREDFPEIDDDEAYLVDLLDARIRHVDGRELGTIVGFSDNNAQPLAEVKLAAGGHALMPLVPGIVTDIDEDARVVTVDPPEGLLEGDAVAASDEPDA